MNNVYMFQPNYTHPLGHGIISCWLPYSVAVLWHHAEQNKIIKNNYNLAGLYFRRTPVAEVIEQLVDPKIAAFSCYTWNWEYTKAVAKLIKDTYPDCLIVFGGPEIPGDPIQNLFFEKHPYVDTVIVGEGEEAFLHVLLTVHEGNIPDKIIKFPRMPELISPSPYVKDGVLERLMKANPEIIWNTTLETNRGCPYQCTFCDWGSLTQSKIKCFSEERVLNDIEWISNNQIPYVFLADANFGILVDRDMRFTQHIRKMQDLNDYPKKLYVTWAKSFKRKETLDIIKEFYRGLDDNGLIISVQSLHDQTLIDIKRSNFQLNDIENVAKECNDIGLLPMIELILGLPNETKETWKANYCKILSLDATIGTTQTHLLTLLENSELNSPEQRVLHGIQTVEVSRHGPAASDNEILEKEEIVCATNTMPFDDFVESFMFTYIASTYYDTGWIRIIVDYLKKHGDFTIEQLLFHLEDSLINGDGYLSQEYHRVRSFFAAYMSNLDPKEEQQDLTTKTMYLPIASIAELYLNHDRVIQELSNIYDMEFTGLDKAIHESLFEIQDAYMYSNKKTYPYTINDTCGIYAGAMTSNSPAPATLTVDYHLHPIITEDPEEIFFNLLYQRRKSISNTKITTESQL